MTPLSFYFDFISPFSYFAFQRISEVKSTEIEFFPVPLGSLLNYWGIKGPGEVQPKREFLLKTCLRYAERNSMPFTTPKTHPFNSLYALRLSLKEVAGPHQHAVIAALWEAGWVKRMDMGDPDVLQAVLREKGLPAEELFEKSFSKEARQGLKTNLARALEAGVFGVPSFVSGAELFWGNDSFTDLNEYLAGRDRLDRAKLEDLLASTPRAAAQTV